MKMNGQTLMLPIRIRTMTAKNVKINVPYVDGGTTAAAQETMNKAIAAATQELMKAQGFPSDDIQEMDGTFEIKTNQRGVLSLSLLNYAFTGSPRQYVAEISYLRCRYGPRLQAWTIVQARQQL